MKTKSLLLLFVSALWGCSDSTENTGSGGQEPDQNTHGQAGTQAKSGDSSGGKTITTTATDGASGNPSQDKAKNQNWIGRDLLAEANTREDGLSSSTRMLEKLFNEEMTSGKIINSRLVSKDPAGEIVYGADARPTVLAKKDGAIELYLSYRALLRQGGLLQERCAKVYEVARYPLQGKDREKLGPADENRKKGSDNVNQRSSSFISRQ